MTVFLSTDDGRIFEARLGERRAVELADFSPALNGQPLAGLALTSGGLFLGATSTRVYALDIATKTVSQRAVVTGGGGIVGLDVDGSDRALIGMASGQVWRQERTGTLTDIGQFPSGIQGGLARIGGFAFAVGQTGVLSVMNILDGTVTELQQFDIGTVVAIAAEGRTLRLTLTQTSGQPQFFVYDIDRDLLSYETGLRGFHASIADAAQGRLAPVIAEGDGGEFIGTPFDDVFHGTAGSDRAFAREGDDSLSGGAGDDLLMGEWGNDTLDGGTGDDAIYGGDGIDWAVFGDGPSQVDLMLTDPQETGHGLDYLEEIENLLGGAGADWFAGDYGANVLEGRGGPDTLIGRGGDDTLRGGSGNDMLWGDTGNDVIDGGEGTDTVLYLGETAVRVDLGNPYAQVTGQGTDVLRNVENVTGSSAADTLSGNSGANQLVGGTGFDILKGGGGNDTLWGDKGYDWLHGGDGADLIYGGNGRDTLDGGLGSGVDTLVGDAGADCFVFTVLAPDGRVSDRLVIADFSRAEGDVIDLVGASPADFARWQVSAIASGALVSFENGTLIELHGVAPDEVAPDWFV